MYVLEYIHIGLHFSIELYSIVTLPFFFPWTYAQIFSLTHTTYTRILIHTHTHTQSSLEYKRIKTYDTLSVSLLRHIWLHPFSPISHSPLYTHLHTHPLTHTHTLARTFSHKLLLTTPFFILPFLSSYILLLVPHSIVTKWTKRQRQTRIQTDKQTQRQTQTRRQELSDVARWWLTQPEGE